MFLTQASSDDCETWCRLDVLGLADSPLGDQQEVYTELKEQLHRDAKGWYEPGLQWRGNYPSLSNKEAGTNNRSGTLIRELRPNK